MFIKCAKLQLWFAAIMCAGLTVDAGAQPGTIGLYSDAGYTSCELIDAAPPVVRTLYIVHRGTAGASAVRFMLAPGAGFDCGHLAEDSPFTNVVGDTQSGVFVNYDACVASDILVFTVSYFCSGTTPACGTLDVVPAPLAASGQIEVTDCVLDVATGLGTRLVVNPDGSCPCGSIPAVEFRTWGAIKAMY